MPDDPPPLPLDEARKVFPPIWVVYQCPQDFPTTAYVVRLWWGLTPEPTAYPCATLLQARTFIRDAGGCMRIERRPDDAPQVLEAWL